MSVSARLVSAFLGLLAFASTPANAQNAAWDIATEAVKAYDTDCRYFSSTDDACRSLFSAFDRALAHPEADSALEHSVLTAYLGARAAFGERLREEGRLDDAARELMIGFQMMMRHFDGGRHFHAIVENQDLQLQTALTMDALGKVAERDQIIANLRKAVDSFDKSRADVKSAGGTALLKTAYAGAFDFEEALAKRFEESTTDATIDDTLGEDEQRDVVVQERLRKTLEAYSRAEFWLRRRAEEDKDRAWSPTQASLSRAQAALCVKLCPDPEVRKFTAQWLAASCRAIPSDNGDLFEPALASLLPGPADPESCETAKVTWAVLNGALDAALDEFIDGQIRTMKDAAEGRVDTQALVE